MTAGMRPGDRPEAGTSKGENTFGERARPHPELVPPHDLPSRTTSDDKSEKPASPVKSSVSEIVTRAYRASSAPYGADEERALPDKRPEIRKQQVAQTESSGYHTEPGTFSAVHEELRTPTLAETRGAYATIAESRMPYVRVGHWTSLAGVDIHIGYENEQIAGSFKARAALLELERVSPETLAVVASSGNHALAFATEARERGIPLVAIVPETTPTLKVEKIKATGATVIQHGPTYESAYLYAQQYAQEHSGHFFDVSSATSIAALSTVVREILEQVPHADAIILPAGGGTLLAGGALVAREYARTRGRDILVIGAVPERAATTYESFKAGQLITTTPGDTIADATRVMQTDPHLLPTLIQHVDDIVVVPESSIREWVGYMSLFGNHMEGAAVLGIAAIAGNPQGILTGARNREIDLRDKTVVTVATGGNIDEAKLRNIHREFPELERKVAEVKRDVADLRSNLPDLNRILNEQKESLKEARGRVVNSCLIS
jgi:threonine dehydratase